MAGQCRDQVRARHDGTKAQEAGQFQHYAPLYLRPGECGFQDLVASAGDDADMSLPFVICTREAATKPGVARVGEADPILSVECLLVEARLKRRDQAERQVGL